MDRATHYSRGVDALEAHAYPQAVSELSAAKVLFVDYRDARTLEDQARAARSRPRRPRVRRRRRACRPSTPSSRRPASGSPPATPPARSRRCRRSRPETCGLALERSDAVRAASGSLATDLAAAASAALRRAQWGRAGSSPPALLVLEPSDDGRRDARRQAATGQELSAQLAKAERRGRGQWRTALRLALAVTAVRKDFPGAAALIADARTALAPKPEAHADATAAADRDHAVDRPAGGTSSGSSSQPPPP